jgi:LacI family transcriptional regulator
MQSIEHHARKRGANIMLYLDNLEVETERENILNVIARGVDGILMVYIGGGQNLDCLELIRAAGIPLLLLDRYIEELAIDSVSSDNYMGAFRAVQRFLAAGFRSVVYVTAPIDSSVLRDRLRGYTDAMKERDVALDIRELKQGVGEGTDRLNYDRTRDLVAQLEFPAAIFSSDATRLALITEHLQNRGIPNSDYALGCFDEPYISFPEDLLFVKVLQPLREIGGMAVDLILGQVEGERASNLIDKPTRILLAPEILCLGENLGMGLTTRHGDGMPR